MRSVHHPTPRRVPPPPDRPETLPPPPRRTRRRPAQHLAAAVAVIGLAACATLPAASVVGPALTAATAATDTIYRPYVGTKAAVAPVGRTVRRTLTTADGRTRTYRIYLPASLPDRRAVPLLIALHGGMGSGEQFAANSGFDGLAEANGFIVVYPDGVGARSDGAGLRTWNGGYCCDPAARRRVDDVGFIRRLIVAMNTRYRIDPDRVFVAGHSNGGILAYRLACELSDQIVAIGVEGASLGVEPCTPRRPVAVFHLHGSADTNHPIDGGVGSGLSAVDFRSALDSVVALAQANRCTMPPVSASGVEPANADLTVTTWTGCRSGAEVRFVRVEHGNHAWMGHPSQSQSATDYMGAPYLDLDASRAIWSFLITHPRG